MHDHLTSHHPDSASGGWRRALLHALPLAALVLGLYYYWFAVADRYIVFLYYHDMGSVVPDTSPFSDVTSSRYWMTGLVAGGLVMVIHTAAAWIAGRLAPRYIFPAWWRVWPVASVPLLIGIPAITMTVNQPTLPAWNALQTALAALAGLALALLPGQVAAERPGELAWLALDGIALAIVLWRGFFLYPLVRLALDRETAMQVMPLAGFAGSAVALLIVTWLRRWRRTPMPTAAAILLAAACLAYPFMALIHYLVFTDGYYYISNSSNFFADAPLQGVLWLMTGVLALGATRLRILIARK
jgi:hypothetical protein